jgi:hypothetical protein
MQERQDPAALWQRLAHEMAALPAIAAPKRHVLTALRAGALATSGRGLDLAGAAEAAGLPVSVVALGFALRGHPGALDHGLEHALGVTVAYLLSPGAPTRAAGEELVGNTPGTGGRELGHLASTLLGRLAGLPTRRALPVDALAPALCADVAALVHEYPSLRPRPGGQAARRYLAALLAILDAAGLAWLDERGGLAIDAEALGAALRWIADGAPEPGAAGSARATLARDGNTLVIRASDEVPLERLVTAARLSTPRARVGVLELRLEPALLASGADAVSAAVRQALE